MVTQNGIKNQMDATGQYSLTNTSAFFTKNRETFALGVNADQTIAKPNSAGRNNSNYPDAFMTDNDLQNNTEANVNHQEKTGQSNLVKIKELNSHKVMMTQNTLHTEK